MPQLIEQQRDFFNTNATKDINFRKQQLQKLYDAIKSNEQLLYDAIYKDFKKSEFDTFTTELALIYNDIIEAKKKVKKWSKRKRKRTNLVNLPAKSYVIPEPLGVSLVIGAWNYPYQLSFAPAVSAIVAGCTVILKPSEIPSNTSAAIAQIINTNFDPNYFKVVEGGIPQTTELLNQKFDKIFFTGSTAVGRIVYQAAAKHLTPVTLELGGKSPAFITNDCDLKKTVKRLVWSKFLNSGQTCIAPDYILLDNQIKDKFLALLKEEIKNSHFSTENGNYVQIVNSKNTERLINLIDKSKVFIGGNYNIDSRIIEPTVLTNVTFEDKIMEEEIFGPILPIITYSNLDEVISKVKSRPKPLSCYVFTNNSKIKNKILNEISFGGGCVNDAVMHISNSHFGFGGVGDSGIGSYHGEDGFKAFSHYKSILEKSNLIEPNLKYYPHTKGKLSLIKRVMGLK
ncbi:aldehyde dehydrogenase [Urechidicola croceus]|uniref:Aldehyde dehydrogenase n=1 Tax=Urechidicola croceus TaxID=1850246 RepID=A0A1D8P4N8_9FLAO|nr:aldehyde dehydrogenase [Urechidicola croceus]AOW19481.1 aldehyde dehydrogenase [Urechidicola croceus]